MNKVIAVLTICYFSDGFASVNIHDNITDAIKQGLVSKKIKE